MQKYSRHDLVRIAKNLGPYMSHFISDCDAIVRYSFKEKFGTNDDKSYCLYVRGRGDVSWYKEHQFILIKKKQFTLLSKWKKEIKRENDLKKDIDWIFKNGKEVIKFLHDSSIQTLASCLNLDNLWGDHGEAFVYYQNALKIINLSKPYLKTGNKKGWLKYCDEIQEKKEIMKIKIFEKK